MSSTVQSRIVLLLSTSVVLAMIATGCGSGTQVTPADLVLRGGKVVTVDEQMPEAQAIAVSGYQILAVGSDDEIAAYIGDGTEVVELDGRLAMPGFIEGHGHFASLGQAQMRLDLTQAASWEDIVTTVAVAAEVAQPGEWITGRGWHQEKWTEVPTPNVDGAPLHHDLSRVSPDNPVNLVHASGHASFANALALRQAGIGARTVDPPGGTIVKDAQGNPTGLLRETAQRIVGEAIAESRENLSEADLAAEFDRIVELAGEEEFKYTFPDCEIGAMPPFGNLYDMEVYSAESLAEDEEIAFNAGSHKELIRLAYKDFENLVKPKVVKFSLKS